MQHRPDCSTHLPFYLFLNRSQFTLDLIPDSSFLTFDFHLHLMFHYSQSDCLALLILRWFTSHNDLAPRPSKCCLGFSYLIYFTYFQTIWSLLFIHSFILFIFPIPRLFTYPHWLFTRLLMFTLLSMIQWFTCCIVLLHMGNLGHILVLFI